jgi:hypothetical protein
MKNTKIQPEYPKFLNFVSLSLKTERMVYRLNEKTRYCFGTKHYTSLYLGYSDFKSRCGYAYILTVWPFKICKKACKALQLLKSKHPNNTWNQNFSFLAFDLPKTSF